MMTIKTRKIIQFGLAALFLYCAPLMQAEPHHKLPHHWKHHAGPVIPPLTRTNSVVRRWSLAGSLPVVNMPQSMPVVMAQVPAGIAAPVVVRTPTVLASPVTATYSGDEASLLRAAYFTLAKASQDYQGHRISAMKHIAAASSLMGESLGGDETGHGPQGQADAQLIAAQSMLNQARIMATSGVLPEIDAARGELAAALSVR